jgi:hypothetical protein
MSSPPFALSPNYYWRHFRGEYYADRTPKLDEWPECGDYIAQILIELGVEPTQEDRANTSQILGDRDVPLHCRIYRFAIKTLVRRHVIDRLVDKRWREKKMVADYFYRVKTSGGTLPTTKKECSLAMVDMFNKHWELERALRNTLTKWRPFVGCDREKQTLFQDLRLDFNLFHEKGMSWNEFRTRFLRAFAGRTDGTYWDRVVNPWLKFSSRFCANAHYEPLLSPEAHAEYANHVVKLQIPSPRHGNDWAKYVVKRLAGKITRTICLDNGITYSACIARWMFLIDKSFIEDACRMYIKGPWEAIGLQFHLRCLTRMYEKNERDIVDEMFDKVGKAADDGNSAHTLMSAFEYVVKKHFPPYQGKLITFEKAEKVHMRFQGNPGTVPIFLK